MRKTVLLLCLLASPAMAQAPNNPAPLPLPSWFIELDTAKKGEVSRADFVKYRMKSFDDLDTNKDGKISLEEFLKLAEPPHMSDTPGGPNLEERRNRLRHDAAGGRQMYRERLAHEPRRIFARERLGHACRPRLGRKSGPVRDDDVRERK